MKLKIATALIALASCCEARDYEDNGLESFKRYLQNAEFPHSEQYPHKGSCLGMTHDRVPKQKASVGSDYQKTHPKSPYRVDNEEGATAAKCRNGKAAGYPCNNVDLLSVLTLSELNFGSSAMDGTDLWGWHKNGREFALMGIESGTVFVEITDPVNPVIVGKLNSKTASSWWRDIKTIGSYALIVSEAKDHGMQVFNLDRLLSAKPKTVFKEDAHFSGFGNAHNIFVNEDTEVAYAVGTDKCRGGLYMLDVSDPENPKKAGNSGCYSADGYTHDVQCVIYKGPDKAYKNKEICFASNEDTVTILDMQNKNSVKLLSKQTYSHAYTHQGWLTEDHTAFVFNDELDEQRKGFNTRTHVVDVKNLKNPKYTGFHNGRTKSIDHNLYIKGDYIHQANYRAGYNLLKIVDASKAEFEEKGYFDIYPASDSGNFNGAWSTFPYFPSGNVIVSGIEQGLLVLNPNIGGGNTKAPTGTGTKAPTGTGTKAPTGSPGDNVCDGVDKKPCKKVKQGDAKVCTYSTKKKITGGCESKGKFDDPCQFTNPNACTEGDTCKWTNNSCKHICTDLIKSVCKKRRINNKKACKPLKIVNPCLGCHLKSVCKK